MHTSITAVTIKSNKICLNEIKDNEALLEPSYGKKTKNFVACPIHIKHSISHRLNVKYYEYHH